MITSSGTKRKERAEIAQDFVVALVEQRKRLGWSQYRLAKESGLSREYIAQLERIGREPRIGTAQRLCVALGTSFVLGKE